MQHSIFPIFGFLILFVACRCDHFEEGVVLDDESGNGIEDVAIFQDKEPRQIYFSERSGYYAWRGITGWRPKCQKPKLYFIHPEYDTVYNPNFTLEVRMHRRKANNSKKQ
jgi:hypothetical protein